MRSSRYARALQSGAVSSTTILKAITAQFVIQYPFRAESQLDRVSKSILDNSKSLAVKDPLSDANRGGVPALSALCY
jgi:hypothetical protein